MCCCVVLIWLFSQRGERRSFCLVSVQERLHVQLCGVLRLHGRRAVPRAAQRIPRSRTPCGPDTACPPPPSSSGRGHISVGLQALVNIIGRWCVKLTVPVRTPRATSPIKLSRDRPPTPLQLYTGVTHLTGEGEFSTRVTKIKKLNSISMGRWFFYHDTQ